MTTTDTPPPMLSEDWLKANGFAPHAFSYRNGPVTYYPKDGYVYVEGYRADAQTPADVLMLVRMFEPFCKSNPANKNRGK